MIALKRPLQHLVSDGRRHLVCLPYSIKNLHLMRIGRQWFHRDHYDIPVRRRQSIEQSALLVSSKSIVRLIHAHRSLRMMLPQVAESENLDFEEKLFLIYKQQGKTGVHFCPEWNYMAIHDKSIEFEACRCGDIK